MMMGIFNIQHPWTFTFGILGNVISVLVYFAPVTTFYRVYRKKSTEDFHSLPYLVALFSSMLWLYYALLKTDAMLLITINSFGCVIEMIYISLFIFYAPCRTRKLTIKLFALMNMGVFSIILVVTQLALRHPYRIQALGWICVATSVSVFAAPLSIVAQVIRTKSIEYMPFTLSFFLTLSAIMWFAYGLLLKDICIAVPNVLGFVLGLLQMVLYAIYKNYKITVMDDEEKKLREHMKNIVPLSKLATSDQVHPVVAVQTGDDVNKDSQEHDRQDDDHHDQVQDQKAMEVALGDPQTTEAAV